MHINSLSKRSLAGILLFSQLLTGCLSPSLDPDKSSLEPAEEQTTSPSSSMAAFTKQEGKAQELTLQTSTQEKTPLAADKQTLNLQTVEEAQSNEQVDIKEQEHVVAHQTKIIQGLEAKKKLVKDQTTSTNTVSKAIIFNQESLNENSKKSRETKKIKTSHQISLPLGNLGRVSKDILRIVSSYVGSKHMGKVRQLSKAFYQLTTGYEVPGIVGVAHKHQANMLISGLDINKKVVNFSRLRELSPENIPSFPWYQLVGEVQHLPQCFWPYIAGTQVHTLNLTTNQIGDEGAKKLAKILPSTQVHTLDLTYNNIGTQGATALAKALPSVQVHTLNLYGNQIDAEGASELAKVLPNTQVHTLDLELNRIGAEGIKKLAAVLPSTQVHILYSGYNRIGDEGVAELAKYLPSTQVHTLYLFKNQIGDEGAKKLAKALPSTQVHILYLGNNTIGDEGVAELAKALPSTQVHTLYLRGNQISDGMQKLLRQENFNITYYF